MDVGVSRFWKSPPQRAEQVDICSPTWLPDGRVGTGRRAGGGGSKGRLRHYFQTHSTCQTPSPKALMMVMEEGGMLIFLDLSVDPHGLKQPNAYSCNFGLFGSFLQFLKKKLPCDLLHGPSRGT